MYKYMLQTEMRLLVKELVMYIYVHMYLLEFKIKYGVWK